MQINRHNYEEFFLLYVDNELSAADRNAVELFVRENADLEEELNMLQQTVFNADAVVFDNKASLLKEEITALQENLLLYIDGELNTADKLNTERLVLADAAANKELAVLQQTKLQPDTAIVFANKKILYRKEGGRVIDLPWRRIAVAAILLGFGTWATISFINSNGKAGSGTTAANIPGKTNIAKQIENTVTPGVQQQQPAVTESAAATANANDAVKQAAQKNNQPAVNNKVRQNIPEQKDDDNAVAQNDIKKPSNNLPQPVYNNFNKAGSNENASASVTLPKTTGTIESGFRIPVDETKQNSNDVVNGYALNANFTESDDPNNLSTDDNKGKKSKLGGFIRKVKRMVERNTNTTNGNGVKIAGFDIAIK